MTAALIVAVWFFAPIVGAAAVLTACRAVDARHGRPAARGLAEAFCPEHGHACQPHDHQTPGGTR